MRLALLLPARTWPVCESGPARRATPGEAALGTGLEAALDPHQRQSWKKTLGQLWGLLFLTALFGFGAYRLLSKGIDLFRPEAVYFVLYGLLTLIGAAKGEFVFRRQFINRTLARGRTALGETGWDGDYVLAPFCMLSLYRPWQTKHLVISWVLIPVMVALAILFVAVIADGPFKGAVDWGIGLALAYAALILLVYLLRFLWWLLVESANQRTIPLPELQLRGPGREP
jgi:hypothetical protein